MAEASISLKSTAEIKSSINHEEKIFHLSPWLFELIISVLAFLLLFFSYIIIKPLNGLNSTRDGAFAKGYVFILMAIEGAVTLYLFFSRKMNYRRAFYLIFIFSFLMRMMYMLYTGGHLRQHDTWSVNDDGHYAYALSFYLTGQLPSDHITVDTIYQFYHPPLNAFIQGMWMHVFEALSFDSSLKANTDALYCSCQILSCFYMYITSLFFSKIIIRSKLSDKAKLLALAIVCLFPRLIQLSGQLNNDGISIMFSSIALYYFYRWYFENKSHVFNILTALFVGLAMFGKMSAVSICLGMAVGYIIQLIRSIRKKEDSLPIGKLLLQYAIFLCIAAPIGLWWQIYTPVVYHLPFNFVFKNLNADLFTGTQSWVINNRASSLDYYNAHNSGVIYENGFYNFIVRYVFPIQFEEFSFGVFCNAGTNYNILSYALRSSIFGEFSYWDGDAQGIAVSATALIYVAWISLLVSSIYNIAKSRKVSKDFFMALYLMVGMTLMFLYLQISMPYGCSMDFRYIVPIILPVGYLAGKNYDLLGNISTPVSKGLSHTLTISTALFLISSNLFYLCAI